MCFQTKTMNWKRWFDYGFGNAVFVAYFTFMACMDGGVNFFETIFIEFNLFLITEKFNETV